MKVAHFSLWAPGRSGLFQYVADQIKYERKAGIDSVFIHSEIENPDPNRFKEYTGDPGGYELVAKGWKEAQECDVWVMHRSIPAKLLGTLPKKKNVVILHGTSEIMIQHEISSHSKNDKFNMHIDFLDTFKKVITITKSDDAIMRNYNNGRNKIVYINDAIDLEKYSPAGHAWPFKYRPALCSFTNIRTNKYPSYYIWAMPEIIKLVPNARLNLFGINLTDMVTWKNIILKSGPIGVAVENIHGQFTDLRPFMRNCDISLNSNISGIFSRDSMESMGCGASVIAATNEHTPYAAYRDIPSIAKAVHRAWEDLAADPKKQIEKNRAYAEENFCMEKATKKFIDLYNSL